MRRREFVAASGFPAVLARARAQGGAGSITLLEPGASAEVAALPDDAGTAGYFVKIFEALTGSRLELSSHEPASPHRPAVLIGDIQNNAQVRRLAGARVSRMTSESILLATASD
ncbi:MAG: hypothetical protein ABFD86_11640, partial [Bryobacteraceae bacterium]